VARNRQSEVCKIVGLKAFSYKHIHINCVVKLCLRVAKLRKTVIFGLSGAVQSQR
jgi:hypothetical protein